MILCIICVQYSHLQFLKIILCLPFLYNIIYIFCIVQYIIVAYFIQNCLFKLLGVSDPCFALLMKTQAVHDFPGTCKELKVLQSLKITNTASIE